MAEQKNCGCCWCVVQHKRNNQWTLDSVSDPLRVDSRPSFAHLHIKSGRHRRLIASPAANRVVATEFSRPCRSIRWTHPTSLWKPAYTNSPFSILICPVFLPFFATIPSIILWKYLISIFPLQCISITSIEETGLVLSGTFI